MIYAKFPIENDVFPRKKKKIVDLFFSYGNFRNLKLKPFSSLSSSNPLNPLKLKPLFLSSSQSSQAFPFSKKSEKIQGLLGLHRERDSTRSDIKFENSQYKAHPSGYLMDNPQDYQSFKSSVLGH